MAISEFDINSFDPDVASSAPASTGGFDPDNPFAGAAATSDLDSLVFDLTSVDENAQGALLPPGIYDAIVDDCEFKKAQSSGNNMLAWIFEVIDPNTNKPRKLYFFTSFTDGGMPRVKRTILRVAPETDLKAFRPAVHANQFIGRKCRVKVRHRAQDGQMRADVADVLPPLADAATLNFLDA